MVLASPGLIFFCILVLLPIVLSFYYSFHKISFLTTEFKYTGIINFIKLFYKNDFHNSIKFTLTITIVSVFIANSFGLAVALLLDSTKKIYVVLRVLFFVPFILSPVVIGYIYGTILTDNGILNNLLSKVGINVTDLSWLGNPTLALVSVTAALCWQLIAFCTVIFIASLQTVPKELLDASSIDGANYIQKFYFIIWPLIAPAFTINTVVILISSFKLFDRVATLTGGGPGRATETISMIIIRTAFTENRVGLASAMSLNLLILSGAVTIITMVLLNKREIKY